MRNVFKVLNYGLEPRRLVDHPTKVALCDLFGIVAS